MTKAALGLVLLLMMAAGATTFAQAPKTIALADATIADINAAFDMSTWRRSARSPFHGARISCVSLLLCEQPGAVLSHVTRRRTW
jgi:hypothetical protein